MALPFDDELTQFLAQNIWLDPLLLPAKFPLPTELIAPPMFPPPLSSPRPTKNKSHNAIERRYRNNINERIAELKAAVPALQYTRQKADDDEDSEEYVDGVSIASKLNKATIMRKATEYIVHLQHTNDQLKVENQILEQLVRQLPGGAPVLARYKSMQQQQHDDDDDDDMQHKDDDNEQGSNQQHTFMALFLCLSFSMDQNITSSAPANAIASSASSDVWSLIRASLLVMCLVYLLFRRRHEEKQNTFMLVCSLAAECVQQAVRHMFGWAHAADDDETERWMHVHANPSSPPLLRLYACARMMNVASQQQLTYVYACAAMQSYPYSQWLARHFWRLAMYATDDDMLVWDVHQQPPCEDTMLDSQAWKEAVERNADLDELSRLHLLENLRTELGRLVISVTSSPPSLDQQDQKEETAFERVLANDEHAFPRYIAAVGATVEALWQSDINAAERALSVIEHKNNLLKMKIKLVLQAAIRLKQGDLTGMDLLSETVALQKQVKKELGYRRQERRGTVNLEGETMALAEFVVCLTGLHAWIDAWRLGCKVSEQIKAQTLVLRRMMRCSSLEKLPAHQILVDRLSRLGYFVSPNGSDDDEEEDDDDDDDEQTRPAKTLDILRGLA